MDNNAKSQAIEQIKKAQNVLVTVSDDPSVDQLSACIGFTLLLNKLNKHATAVFSGKIPSTIEFLKPENTLETNTDSLRDFIISLDKNKADKLRYKVEDDVVRIYITPYRTSISDKDLVFDQGDFNVDVIVALGVHSQDQLDKAIQNHGRILHDATIIGIVTGETESEIGGINWQDKNASSLCEMLMSISESLKPGIVDEQIATALLTGIVAETDRFSNQKTTPKAMTMSAQLMSAGANQQLIAESLNQDKQDEDNLPGGDEEEQNDEPSLADIQINESEPDEEEIGVLNLHHEKDNSKSPEITNNFKEPILKNNDVYQNDLEYNDLNNPTNLRKVVNEVQQNKKNYDNKEGFNDARDGDLLDYSLPKPDIDTTQNRYRNNQNDLHTQSDYDNSSFSKGSFKGKNIAPPADFNAPNPLLNEASRLPEIDGALSYNPGGDMVTNAPLSATDDADSYSRNFILPKVDRANNEEADSYPANKQQNESFDSRTSFQSPSPSSYVPEYKQGSAFIDPASLPKAQNEDLLTDDEAKNTIANKNAEFDKIPEIKLDKQKKGFLDHAPTTGPNDSQDEFAIDDEEELPSIERGKPKYSKYLGDPPKDNPKLNSLEGVVPDQTINPFTDSTVKGEVPKPQDIKSTQDPLLATQHDAESASAREVPETRSPRLYDDGVGVGNKPLGAPVDDNDTLDQIEHNVEQTVGAVHGHKVNDARKAVNDAFEELDLNSLYLGLDSDPAVKQGDDTINNAQNDEAPPPLPPPLMPPGLPS